jgi:hypothetical protein
MAEREQPDRGAQSGISRRTLMRRGAVLGGAVWATPVIQSLAAPAFSQVYPQCEACLAAVFDPDGPGGQPPIEQHVTLNPTPQCCACIAAGGGGIGAVVLCAVTGDCTINSFGSGPCP